MHEDSRPRQLPPNFQYKKFIKATSTDDLSGSNTQDTNSHNNIQKGCEVQQFYEDLIKEPKVQIEVKSEKVKSEVKCEKIKKETCDDIVTLVDSEDEISVIDPAVDRKLLLASQQGDIDAVCNCLKYGADVNTRDDFGWSPLMIASAEGHVEIVQKLLKNGADKKLKDKSGRNASHLARLKGYFHIEDLILSYDEHERTQKHRRKRKSEKCGEEFDTCEICHEVYAVKDVKKHKVSLSHQLAMEKISKETANPGFLISQNNKGYQMLKQSGWDGKSGLGSHDHKGRLFPVKSVLKRDRSGFQEGLKRTAKITHFGANDVDSVKRVQKHSRGHTKSQHGDKRNANVEREIRESLNGL